jgi:hypothetical protein
MVRKTVVKAKSRKPRATKAAKTGTARKRRVTKTKTDTVAAGMAQGTSEVLGVSTDASLPTEDVGAAASGWLSGMTSAFNNLSPTRKTAIMILIVVILAVVAKSFFLG